MALTNKLASSCRLWLDRALGGRNHNRPWNKSSKNVSPETPHGETGDARPRLTGRPRPGTTAVDRGADLLVRVLESEQPVALTDLASRDRHPEEHRLAARQRARAPRSGRAGRPARAPAPGPAILRVAERSMLERNIVELAGTAPRRARRGQRRDDQPRRARRTRASSTRAGRQRALPRHRPVARPHGRLPLHRRRQGVPGLRTRGHAGGAARLTRRTRSPIPTGSEPSSTPCAAPTARPRSTSSSPGWPRSPRRCAAPAAMWSRRSASPARRCG